MKRADESHTAYTVRLIREQALLDAAREVDRVLIEIGALEGSSIHSALSLARRRVLDLKTTQAPSKGDGT